MSIAQLPVIAQLIELFSVLMNWVYDIYAGFGVHNAIAYIITFAILSRIILLPSAISGHKKTRVSAILKPISDDINNKYKKLDKKIYGNKIAFERFIISNKYDSGKNSGCASFLIQFPIIIALYYVVGHLAEFVPEIAAMNETELLDLYNFAGLDIRNTPGTTLMLIFPLSTFVVQSIHSISMNLLNKRKVDAVGLFSNFLTVYLGLKFPTFLSIYWLAQGIFSFISSFILTLYFNKKDADYFINKKLRKINSNRAKKGFDALLVPIDIEEENAEETALYEKELGIVIKHAENNEEINKEENRENKEESEENEEESKEESEKLKGDSD